LSRPADVPDPDFAETARPADVAAPLEVDDLTWRELAEAVYLAAVIRPQVEPEPPTGPKSPPEEADRVTAQRGEPEDKPGEPEPVEDSVPQPDTRPEPGPVHERPQRIPGLDPDAPTAPGDAAATSTAGWSLHDRLNITRALRPLKRFVTSRRAGDVVIDEIATAERAVQDELWWPETRQRRERWLDLTIVIDAAPSMTLWRHKIAAFVELLEQLGAFRTIRVKRLDTDRSAAGVPLSPVLCGATGPRDPSEVVDHSGRHAVLVITDGLGEAWRSDLIGPTLAQWGRTMPVSVIHCFPQWMWGRHGPALHRVRLTAEEDLRPNRTWSVELLDAWLAPVSEQPLPESAVPVPVLELKPRWLAWWSRLLTIGHRSPADATVLLASDKPQPRVSVYENAHESTTARDRIAEFRSAASPDAQRLAQLLAALPGDISVARHVQNDYLPGTGPELMGELLAAKLLRYASRTARAGSTLDSMVFDIAESDREVLLEGARRSDTAGVVRMAARQYGHRIGALKQLNDAIADPDNAREPAPADRPLQRLVLRALSGPYLLRVERLEDSEPGPDPSTSTRESVIMSQAAERPPAVSATSDLEAVEHTQSTTPHIAATFAHGLGDRQPGDPPAVWGNVPPRNLNFTGRDDLIEDLHSHLAAGGTTVVLPATLHGMGGIGKTQTAAEYIYRHLDDYDLVWWIAAGQPTQIRSGLTELAKHLGLPGSSEAHTAVPAVLEALRRGNPIRRWLLVFDAAETPEAVRKFFPSNGPGQILITSRNPTWANVARPVEVSVFRRVESMELLRRRGPDISDGDADQIADKLGDLPLAIEQAAAWRAETGMPVREYLRLFEEKVAEIFESSTTPDYEVPLAAAWNVSFDELRNHNPAAHQILLICAFFSSEPISRDLFTGVRNAQISPELDVTLRDPIQLARAIREINRYGLAKIDHGTNTIQLHRLVQLVLRNRITTPTMQTQMRHGAHQLLANIDPNDPEKSKNWPLYRELLPHAYAADVVNCNDGWVRQLVINLMRFLYQWGDHDEAASLAERAYRDFTDKLGPNDPQTLEVAWRLGFYLWVLGRFREAAELNQNTFRRRIQVSGEDSEETFGVQANILLDLKAKGDFAAARQLSEELFHRASRLFGPDDPETLTVASLHGMSLRLMGDFSGAREMDENTHQKMIDVLGRDNLQTQGTYVSIVVDRREQGEYSWARIEHEKLVERAIELHGSDRQNTQLRIYLLSIARRKDGDHDGAFELSGPVLDNFRLRYGSVHQHTVGCVLAHSIDLRHAGDLDEARRLGDEAVDSYRQLWGDDHPHTSAAKVDLGVTLRLGGDAAGARDVDERAFDQLRAKLGADHPNAVVAGINLASDLAALGETDAAIVLGQEMLERSRGSLGPDHPTTLAAELNLIFDLRTAGHDDTDARFSDVLTRYRRTLGEKHRATVSAASGSRANCDIDPMIL
jgi:tetratricopeptide (TPR) repeat protein